MERTNPNFEIVPDSRILNSTPISNPTPTHLPSDSHLLALNMSPKTTPSSNFLKHHRPKLRLNEARIPPLSEQSKQSVVFNQYSKVIALNASWNRCLRNLVSYRRPKSRIPIPRSRSAAVLVALFVGRAGDLYVLLSR